MVVLPHPPYSPSLFLPFSLDMDQPKSCQFKDAAEVSVALKVLLQKVTHGGFKLCFQQLYEIWQIFIDSEGQLFKGSYI
jgi:hypothetical protein